MLLQTVYCIFGSNLQYIYTNFTRNNRKIRENCFRKLFFEDCNFFIQGWLTSGLYGPGGEVEGPGSGGLHGDPSIQRTHGVAHQLQLRVRSLQEISLKKIYIYKFQYLDKFHNGTGSLFHNKTRSVIIF